MLKRLQYQLNPNPVCSVGINRVLEDGELSFYDKDGFELTYAEREYYKRSGHPINDYLNHHAYQTQWFSSVVEDNFYLDHSAILHRCSFEDQALFEVEEDGRTGSIAAKWLAQSKQKWGLDFAIEAIDENTHQIMEVLHIEHDSHIFTEFVEKLLWLEDELINMDWDDARKSIAANRNEWQYLKGYKQNDWKANFLLGWEKAETTEKAMK